MGQYNLDEASEHFEFVLGGNNYRMRYPTTEEITDSQKLEEGSQEQLDWFYGFIAPVQDGPPIQDALKKVNVKVLQKFNHMVKQEFAETE